VTQVQISSLKLAHFSNLAMCHLRLGNIEKARIWCTKALNMDPENVKALFRRGKCNLQLGILDEARSDLERVLSQEPNNRDAMRGLRDLKAKEVLQRKKEQKKFAGFFDKLADEEREGGGAASGQSSIAESTHTTAGRQGGPAVEAGKDEGSITVSVKDGSEIDDIGTPLDEPQEFEPQDVTIGT